MGRVALWVAVGAAVALVLLAGAAAGVVSSVFGTSGRDPCLVAATVPTSGAAPSPVPEGLSGEQAGNASVIVATGERMRVPVRGWVIAVATALQESGLVNIRGGDRDSLGLFQQRPSQGWGTPEQVMNPEYTAGNERLLTVPGWERLPLTEAAQAVQRSAYPDAYAKHEARATEIVAAVGSGIWRTIPGDLEQCLNNCPGLVDTGEQSSPTPGCPPEIAVLGRAATWLTAWDGGPVPYLSSSDSSTWFRGYRRDCSGYASMALGLAGPGLNTAGLAARSTAIEKSELRAGDLLINSAPRGAGHVVIFDRWTDATMSRYVGYEQSGSGGTHHRDIPYPYFGGYRMSPYRFAG